MGRALRSALQTLHKVSAKAREHNYFLGGLTHDWVAHYEGSISSDRSCLNEWHAMDSLESRRPPSPDSIRHKPGEKDETETVIRSALKEIMMSVDLDEVTSKQVRTKLEEALDMDLAEFKSFIDQEMLVILGQMDQATEIFSHVYLGSEWNASNLEELHKNGVCHILNVTREIDNFFPGMFDYLNIRVYDDEKTDLLKHWDDTFKYITKAKAEGSKVLVHCKMGVSRSASVVIAYAMKAYSWDLKKALSYVQNKRNCIKPNSNFISQLETYEGILDANKNKEKLQRSKSETNLKRNISRGKGSCKERSSIGEERKIVCASEKEAMSETSRGSAGNLVRGTVTPPLLPSTLPPSTPCERLPPLHAPLTSRPKSWSPDHHTANHIFTHTQGGVSVSIERLPECVDGNGPPPPPPLPPSPPPPPHHNINVRLPCANGLAYSVSQNKAMQLSSCNSQENGLTSNSLVKHKVSALESKAGQGRKKLVLNVSADSLEKRTKPEPPPALAEHPTDPPNQEVKNSSSVERAGLVKHLRREFEARGGGSGGGCGGQGENGAGGAGGGGGGSGEETQSLPSSPVSEREELSVRRLVGRYERPCPPPPLHPHHPHPHHHHHHHHPPPPPARRKQEQGRTHPLTRLSILHKTRHTNPVYNTM